MPSTDGTRDLTVSTSEVVMASRPQSPMLKSVNGYPPPRATGKGDTFTDHAHSAYPGQRHLGDSPALRERARRSIPAPLSQSTTKTGAMNEGPELPTCSEGIQVDACRLRRCA